ncbi:COPI associated protein-domain-containing protein [Apodospora peruviana]|uniref:COPI associated protein-domain-containing protein n=1 Tax=Apodospora peruviana TaxID=516989 RepID=A0AAE0M487_9PEZI|nr:COPI associated protein-domain-containing protein [Apodospora peruviana]
MDFSDSLYVLFLLFPRCDLCLDGGSYHAWFIWRLDSYLATLGIYLLIMKLLAQAILTLARACLHLNNFSKAFVDRIANVAIFRVKSHRQPGGCGDYDTGRNRSVLPDRLEERVLLTEFPQYSQPVIVGCYVIIFGLEFQIPPQVSRYASFLFSFLGRGIFYIFVGCIILSGPVLKIIAGSIVGLIGVAYVVLEFIPSIEPPANMREADAGWGAEQV